MRKAWKVLLVVAVAALVLTLGHTSTVFGGAPIDSQKTVLAGGPCAKGGGAVDKKGSDIFCKPGGGK